MVITPGIQDLPYTIVNGRKFFELTAEEILWELVDGIVIRAWGYNGSTPGPTIHVFPGDKVTIRVTNHLPHRTSVHWHGLEVPNLMDGVPPLEPSPYIYPGEYFDYSFTIGKNRSVPVGQLQKNQLGNSAESLDYTTFIM